MPPSQPPARDEVRRLFAVAAPGLEALTTRELRELGIAGAPTPGGVSFSGGRHELYRANLSLRTASRVIVRLGSFHAAAFPELRKKAGRLPWDEFLRRGQPVAIHATCHKSKLYHSDAVAERVAGAIGDRLGQEPPTEKGSEEAGAGGAQLIIVRLVRDQCTISLDSSGALLHQRGYRLATAKALLRETLAAGMLLASGWDRAAPLIDPFCGAGTVAIEAALLAGNAPPGQGRHFAFMDWPDFEPRLWRGLLETAAAGKSTRPSPAILAADRDAGAIAAAVANAERAGVAAAIQFSCRSISELTAPPGPGWVVTNPPYGLRLSEQHDLRNLYARFGQVLRQRCPGWWVAMLNTDIRLAHATGVPFDEARRLSLVNGGLKVQLVQGRV